MREIKTIVLISVIALLYLPLVTSGQNIMVSAQTFQNLLSELKVIKTKPNSKTNINETKNYKQKL